MHTRTFLCLKEEGINAVRELYWNVMFGWMWGKHKEKRENSVLLEVVGTAMDGSGGDEKNVVDISL